MYRIEDGIMAIREIQYYLFVIGDTQENGVNIAVDGIYSEETEKAVKEFQALYGLDATGEVNKETFDKIYAEYYIITSKNGRNNRLPEWNEALSLGSTGETTSLLNLTLLSLREFYKDIPQVREGGFFSRSTEDAVKFMQSLFGNPVNGAVTQELYIKILEEAKRIKEYYASKAIRRS